MEKEKPNLNEIFGQYSAKQAMKDSLHWLTEEEKEEYVSLMITKDEIIDAFGKFAVKIIKEMIIDTERYKSIKSERQMMYAINAVIRRINSIMMDFCVEEFGDNYLICELSESYIKNKKCMITGLSGTLSAKGDTWLKKIQYMILIHIKREMEKEWDVDGFCSEGYESFFFHDRYKRMLDLSALEWERNDDYEGK